jgi:hypothetical protein
MPLPPSIGTRQSLVRAAELNNDGPHWTARGARSSAFVAIVSPVRCRCASTAVVSSPPAARGRSPKDRLPKCAAPQIQCVAEPRPSGSESRHGLPTVIVASVILIRNRVRPHLKMDHLRYGPFAGFGMEGVRVPHVVHTPFLSSRRWDRRFDRPSLSRKTPEDTGRVKPRTCRLPVPAVSSPIRTEVGQRQHKRRTRSRARLGRGNPWQYAVLVQNMKNDCGAH